VIKDICGNIWSNKVVVPSLVGLMMPWINSRLHALRRYYCFTSNRPTVLGDMY
jgi:hypothetical protein